MNIMLMYPKSTVPSAMALGATRVEVWGLCVLAVVHAVPVGADSTPDATSCNDPSTDPSGGWRGPQAAPPWVKEVGSGR